MDEQEYANALPPGTRFGRVVLQRAIGQGAWGIVYEGTHDVFGRVAVKEFYPSSVASRRSNGQVTSSAPQWQDAVRRGRERFIHEAEALRSIRSEHVVAVHEFIEENGVALLVMEFIEGRPLAVELEAGRFSEPARVVALGATLVDTLIALHAKNLLHRDIAPDNIMIRPDGSPVLIDFGGAAAVVASVTRSTQHLVKDGYSPPEQYDSSGNPTFQVGPWSDIYATGAVLYRLASGREPFTAQVRATFRDRNQPSAMVPLRELSPAGYAPEWLAAVDDALEILPSDRPQDAAAWRRRFDRSEAPVAAKHEVAGRTPSLLPPKAMGVIAAVTIGAAVLAALFITPRRNPHPAYHPLPGSPSVAPFISVTPAADFGPASVATRAGCEQELSIYQSNPSFYGRAAVDRMKAERCDRWIAIPPYP